MLTKELALELAPRGIRVNAVAPGWVDTPGNQATGRMQAAAGSIPLGRVAAPEEIAKWVIILCQRGYKFPDWRTVVLSGGAFSAEASFPKNCPRGPTDRGKGSPRTRRVARSADFRVVGSGQPLESGKSD